MEAHPEQVTPTKARKRILQRNNWKLNIKKLDRNKPKGLPNLPTCGHNKGSFYCTLLDEGDIEYFQRAFYSINSKADQDSFIIKHVKATMPSRRRVKKEGQRPKTTSDRSFQSKCFIARRNNELIPVCHQMFMTVLQIGKNRLQNVVKRFFKTHESPKEKRGGDRKSGIHKEKVITIIKFIKSLNCSEAHYCRSKSGSKRYLPSELNINKLYRMFCNLDPPCNQHIKKWLFRHIFNRKFNLSFKTPQTDVCSTCCELTERIKLAEGEEKQKLMTERRIHALKAKAFYSLLKEEREDLITFSFDCQKNQTLPKLPDQSVYYSRQIYIYNFVIVVGHSKSSLNRLNCFSYTCTEDKYRKDSNLIASGVFHRLSHTNFHERIKTVRLMADGCGGQNKNSILITMCAHWLTKFAPDHIEEVELIFPVVGHSFLPADRVFGNIEKQIKSENVLVSPEEYMNIYSKSTTVVRFGYECSVLNWKQESNLYLKPTGSWHFPFAKCKRFYIRRSFQRTNVIVRGECHYRTDLGKYHLVTKKNKSISLVCPSETLPDTVLLNPFKIKDVKNLLRKHFGENWRENERLSFFHRFYPENEDVNNIDDALVPDEATDFKCERIEEIEPVVV